MERFDVGPWALVKSAAIASVLSQVVGLILLGLFQSGATWGERIAGVFALPMTLIFFGVPAFLWTVGLVLASFYGSRLLGLAWATPYVVGVIGLIWGALLFIKKPALTGTFPGYEQSLSMIIAWTLVVWAFYAHFRLFAGERHG